MLDAHNFLKENTDLKEGRMDFRIQFTNVRIVETKEEDFCELCQVAEEIACTFTHELYLQYIHKEIKASDMEKYRMNDLLRCFQLKGNNKIDLMEHIKSKPNILFTPYGMLSYPFDEKSRAFIGLAIEDQNKEKKGLTRDTYRYLIKNNENILGGIVINTLPKYDMNKEKKIGDVGIFFRNRKIAAMCSLRAIYALFIILDKYILEKHIEETAGTISIAKKELIVDATVHPLNLYSIHMLEKFGFNKIYSDGKKNDVYGEYCDRLYYCVNFSDLKGRLMEYNSLQKIKKEMKIFKDGVEC